MSKFKIGDKIVRTMYTEGFKIRYPAAYVTVTGFTKEGYLLFNNEPDEAGNGWFERWFELYVEPDNKVPDNMEVVGYQICVYKHWVTVEESAFNLDYHEDTKKRILYAFKQD